jgi:hypothetical protein
MFSQAIAGQILNSNMPSLFPLAYYKNAIIILTRKLRFRIFITSTALIVFATLLIFTHWILDRSDRNSSRITRSRTLVSFSLFSDPKTVENKNFLRQDDSGAGARPPLNILALGGSQTWGARLQNRYDAYPWLIGQPFPDHVDNLATRATGADYPSVCLESMIPRNHIEGQPVYDLVSLVVYQVQNQPPSFTLKRHMLHISPYLYSVLSLTISIDNGRIRYEWY